jgi:hypothetical protein
MKTRACPKQGCPEVIEHDHFACRQHWAQLSGHHKHAINAAYARHKRSVTPGSERTLREAQAAATESLNRGRAASVPVHE